MKKIFSLLIALLVLASASADEYSFLVTSPNGAPGVALALLAQENPENYRYIAAETIPAEFAKATSDFIIAPLNAGAKLFKAGKSSYKVAAVVTWGNLYFASQKNFKIKDIKKAGVTLFGENTINSSVALAALEKNGVKPKTVDYLAGAANTQALLLSNPNAIVLTAEPALTAASMKNPKITSYSVNELYKKATGFDGYTQAALFVRAETLEKNPQAVQAFLAAAKKAVDACTSDLAAVSKASVSLGLLPNEKIAAAAIPNCAIRYLSAIEAKSQIEATALLDLAQFGGAVPTDDFYYGEK